MNFQSFLSEELWFLLLLAIVLALVTPQAGLYVTPYAIYFLLAVMFLTSLSISLSEVRGVLKQKKTIAVVLFLSFVVSPLVAYPFSFMLDKDLAVGLIMYYAIPAAMANTFYIKILGKNAALSLVITAVTTLLAPVVTPLIVKLLTGHLIQMNPLDLFITLAELILIPFALAEAVRRYARKATAALLKNSGPISNMCIFFVIFGVISKASGEVWGLGGLAVIVLATFAICFLLGYLSSKKDGLVLGFGNGFRNGTLAMVVALNVFGPRVALVGVVATLVHNVMLVPIMFWAKRKK